MRQRQQKRRRAIPSVHSILDRETLMTALPIHVNPRHVDTLYQLLHQQDYSVTTLADFVTHYRRNPPRSGTQLPHPLLEWLETTTQFTVLTSRIQNMEISHDGSTIKLIIELWDHQRVESVIMKYRHRASLCVSSQCGCAMGCTFCATGTLGWSGNLTAAEILEQVIHANRVLSSSSSSTATSSPKSVRNIVFMGMGEPLNNYRNVVTACRALLDPKRWSLAQERITISTVGIVSKIRQLTTELPQVSLALSLHAPNQQLRTTIVPTAKHYPLGDLIDAVDQHMMVYAKRTHGTRDFTVEQRKQQATRKRAMIEYVMIDGPTSTLECAHELGVLCANRHMLVNLIPYNATDVADAMQCPTMEHILEFQKIVISYGTFCTIRRTMGADIDSACGQLIAKNSTKTTTTSTGTDVRDMEDVAGNARPVRSANNDPVGAVRRGRARMDRSSPLKVQPNWEPWIGPLSVATGVAAACFLVTAGMYVRQGRPK